VVAKRYHHAFLAEKVFNDLSDLMELLEKLGIVSGISKRISHQHDVVYQLTLESVAGRFTRRANEKAWADEHSDP
jgi:hypothetical protein